MLLYIGEPLYMLQLHAHTLRLGYSYIALTTNLTERGRKKVNNQMSRDQVILRRKRGTIDHISTANTASGKIQQVRIKCRYLAFGLEMHLLKTEISEGWAQEYFGLWMGGDCAWCCGSSMSIMNW
ncbi:hypothetical protein AB6A40_001955 [Gnathostoma spinigerum]|uniref:Uncharacterized protein n=1 Tax=Gnathostoma spinigerum TaxID=75299 RepID=A0ABD6E6N4_9BILA